MSPLIEFKLVIMLQCSTLWTENQGAGNVGKRLMYNCAMLQGKKRLLLGCILLACSLPVLGWGLWPMGRVSRTTPALPVELGSAELEVPAGRGAEAGEVLAEPRWIGVEWPRLARLGDAQVIRLTLGVGGDERPEASQQLSAGPAGGPAAALVDLSSRHNVLAEARLEMADAVLMPAGNVLEPMPASMPLVFEWQVRPAGSGALDGVVWVHLRYVPRQEGAEIRRVLSTQRITIQVVDLLGLDGFSARLLGGVGSLLGAALILGAAVARLRKPGARSSHPEAGGAERPAFNSE